MNNFALVERKNHQGLHMSPLGVVEVSLLITEFVFSASSAHSSLIFSDGLWQLEVEATEVEASWYLGLLSEMARSPSELCRLSPPSLLGIVNGLLYLSVMTDRGCRRLWMLAFPLNASKLSASLLMTLVELMSSTFGSGKSIGEFLSLLELIWGFCVSGDEKLLLEEEAGLCSGILKR